MSEGPELYFGYGANKNPNMMEAIIGRKPEGVPAVLHGHELVIQHWNEIPEHVKEVLRKHWNEEDNFSTYVVRRNPDAKVQGTLWQITLDERERIDVWEMNNGEWYTKERVPVVDAEGRSLLASTEMIHDDSIKEVAEGNSPYPAFLNSEEKMLQVARTVRAQAESKS